MQKVEGSSPFSRSTKAPLMRGFLMLENRARPGLGAPGQAQGQDPAELPKNLGHAGSAQTWHAELGSGSRGRVRAACKVVTVSAFSFSFPRRQQARRVRRAAASGSAAIVAGALAVSAAGVGATALAGLLALVMAALLLDARRWVRLAARSRVGARSEGEVRRALAGLEAEGWRLRRSLRWGGRGDIDSVAIAPTGVAFAIESKTRTFDAHHLARARQTAAWLYRHRRRWCRRGALPVLCVVRARGLQGVEDGVFVVSLDRLAPTLRASAGTSPRPGFLASPPPPG